MAHPSRKYKIPLLLCIALRMGTDGPAHWDETLGWKASERAYLNTGGQNLIGTSPHSGVVPYSNSHGFPKPQGRGEICNGRTCGAPKLLSDGGHGIPERVVLFTCISHGSQLVSSNELKTAQEQQRCPMY